MRRVVILLLAPCSPLSLDRRRARAGHAADRHDRERHSLHRRPDRQRLRRLPLRRLPDLRAADRVGPHPRRPAGSARARARRVVGGAQGRSRRSGCSSCARASRSTTAARSTPTRSSSRSSRSRRRTPRTSITYGSGQVSFRLASLIGDHQDRRPHGRVRDQQAHQLRAVPDLLHAHRVADPVAEVQGLAQVRRAAVGHRPLQVTKFVPRERLELEANKSVLGRQAPARRSTSSCCCRCRSRPRGWPRCAAGRWTGSRCRRPTRSRSSRAPGSRSSMNTLPAQLDAHPAAGQGAVEQQARPQGGQLRDRPGRHLQEPAQRHVHPGHRASSTRAIRGSASRRRSTSTTRPRPRTCSRQAGFDGEQASGEGGAAHLHLRLRPDAAAGDERARSRRTSRTSGIDVDLQPVEWNTLLTRWRAGFKTPENEGLNAWNISWNFLEPWSGFGRFFHSKSVVPVSVNTMPYINPEADKLIDEAERTFDVGQAERDPGEAARGGGRRRAVDLRRARPEPARAVRRR